MNQDAERAAFEAWARGNTTLSLQRDPDDQEHYYRVSTEGPWLAWQARAQQAPAEPAEPLAHRLISSGPFAGRVRRAPAAAPAERGQPVAAGGDWITEFCSKYSGEQTMKAGDVLDFLMSLPVSKFYAHPPADQTAALQVALREAADTMRHARKFIVTRERMHPTGVELYDAALAKIDALTKEQPK